MLASEWLRFSLAVCAKDGRILRLGASSFSRFPNLTLPLRAQKGSPRHGCCRSPPGFHRLVHAPFPT